RAGPRLLSFMDASQPLDIRQVTIESLGKLKETSALPRLAEVLQKDPEEKLRQAAATAFGLMAGAGAIEETLLPAYFADASDSVRRGIWSSMLQRGGAALAANEKLVHAFLSAGKRREADQICTRLHAVKAEGELRTRRAAMEEMVARAFFDAGDFKTALPHLK